MTSEIDPRVSLPAWRDTPARQQVVDFFGRISGVPPDARVAVFDNDGTLMSELPTPYQLGFLAEEFRRGAARDPSIAERPEYRAIVSANLNEVLSVGLVTVAMAYAELARGDTPAEFEARARAFFAADASGSSGGLRRRYQPMLELLALLRAHAFDVFIVSGGGTEFLRAVARELYGVKPNEVVGTLVDYEVVRESGKPVIRRAAAIQGVLNEGPGKIAGIQAHLGRQPIVAGGNSAGDRDMLEFAAGSPWPSLALLINHDDAEREFAYASEAGSFTADEAILDTAARLGWTVVSIKNDWESVFADA